MGGSHWGGWLIFDPTEAHSDHYNPLLELRRGEHLHGDCEVIANLIARSEMSRDPIWRMPAAELLTGAAARVARSEHKNPT